MDGTNYELGFRILDLEAQDAKQKAEIANLEAALAIANQYAQAADALKAMESEMDRQRLDLLASQRQVQLAENALAKAKRDVPALQEKLKLAQQEAKALKALNPERLKKQLKQTKALAQEAKDALATWKKRAEADRRDYHEEIDAVKLTLKIMLGECDYFCESENFYLTLSRFAFSTDDPNNSPLRIRVTDRRTSASAVVVDVVDGEPVFAGDGLLSNLDSDIKASIVREHEAIQSTGKCTELAYETYEKRRAEYIRNNRVR